jgi:hypothetical protein
MKRMPPHTSLHAIMNTMHPPLPCPPAHEPHASPVSQVTAEIYQAAVFSFDYLCLVLVASALAGIGLATDNTVRRLVDNQSQQRINKWVPPAQRKTVFMDQRSHET